MRSFFARGENERKGEVKGIFVTGTDTNVGKSIVCGLLGRYLIDQGYNVITQKWVETGCKSSSNDLKCHLRLMKRGRKDIDGLMRYRSPYTFSLASSPHLASCQEKRSISKNKIKNSFRYLAKRFDIVITEGAGGALVPFNKRDFLIDIAKELKLPVLIVVANRLGAINHTLLTIEAIKSRKMKIKGIIFNNQSKKTSKIILKDNPRIVKTLTGQKILGILPYSKDETLLYKAFIPMAKKAFI